MKLGPVRLHRRAGHFGPYSLLTASRYEGGGEPYDLYLLKRDFRHVIFQVPIPTWWPWPRPRPKRRHAA